MLVLSAVNGAGLTIAVGCAISALCIGLVAAFGIAILHTYERSTPSQSKRSTALKLTAEQIRLDTASICSTRPYWIRWPQLQHFIAIHRPARHHHSQSLLYVFSESISPLLDQILSLEKCLESFAPEACFKARCSPSIRRF